MKNFLIALSLSNLSFLSAWHAVLYPPYHGYHLPSPPSGVNAFALILDVLIFAALLSIAIVIVRRTKKNYLLNAAKFTFLFLVIAALNNIIRETYAPISLPLISSAFGKAPAIVLLATIICVTIFALFKWSIQITKIARLVVLLLLPFAVLTFARSAALIAKNGLTTANEVEALRNDSNAEATRGTRVVWIIFDEFDYRAAFSMRPSTLKLPEIDRFANESLFATNAYPPSYETLESLPALITGKIVSDTKFESSDTLLLRYDGTDQFVDWKQEPNIFSKLKSTGAKTALTGWYHPYCRMIGNDLDNCSWWSNYPDSVPEEHPSGLLDSMLLYVRRSGLTLPVIREVLPKFKSYNENFAEMIEQSQAKATELAADSRYSLVFIHFPAPHPPYLYDRQTGKIDTLAESNYFDNLALVDSVFGKLRMAMEQNGTWNDSAVIVSSDHWWRVTGLSDAKHWTDEEAAVATGEKDYRIPYMIKPPNPGSSGSRLRLNFDAEFNTVLTQDLVLAIHNREISSTDEIAVWIDKHRSTGKLNYTPQHP